MKINLLLIMFISFNVYADAESDRVIALEVRFSALRDIKLAMLECNYKYASAYKMKKDMIASKDNTILDCLESKDLEVKNFIDTQNASDLSRKTAKANIEARDCSLETGFLNDVCVYLGR